MTGFEILEQNLTDVIKEEQAKLGYVREKLHLYYPLTSLNHFFSSKDTEEEMAKRLEQLPEELTEKLGKIQVSHKKDRFCFLIPEQGSAYVHENMREDEFIKALVELVVQHDCTLERILELFHRYWDEIDCEKMENGEFDYVIRFVGKEDDRYCYCFKDEGFHFTYHRFLPEDYADFGF